MTEVFEEQKSSIDTMFTEASDDCVKDFLSDRQLELEQKLPAVGEGNVNRIGKKFIELEATSRTK